MMLITCFSLYLHLRNKTGLMEMMSGTNIIGSNCHLKRKLNSIPFFLPLIKSHRQQRHTRGSPKTRIYLKLCTFMFIFVLFYWLCYYSCPNFTPLPSSTQQLPTLFLCTSSLAPPFPTLYFIHPHGYSVTARSYFLKPSPLHPVLQTLLTSGNYQNAVCIYDSVFVLVCLVCWQVCIYCHFICS